MLATPAIGHDRPRAQPAFGRCLIELASDTRRSAAVAVALDAALAEQVVCGASPPTVRIWQNGRALVLPRSRLSNRPPDSFIDRRGEEWPICVRGSGGSAVAHGPGTLNLSLILPLCGPNQPSIEEGYRLWIAILDTALRDAYDIRVVAAPIKGAFCTGRYDAVAGGRKLAGIAQARRASSVVIHGTILAHIDRAEYLRLIEGVEHVVGLSRARGRYDPERIVSLHELIGRAITTHELARAIRGAVVIRSEDSQHSSQQFSSLELARAQHIVEQQQIRSVNRGG